MTRDELAELHYITEIGNIPSICHLGILSHRRADRVAHTSVAMQAIQDRRAVVTVPGGRKLHEYVNLYICARNPMLFRLKALHASLCVLRVSTDVLDLPRVVITDSNASSEYCRFLAAPGGLAIVNRELTFADIWTHPDQKEYWRRKSCKCAEVLVPDRVDPSFIAGAFVSCSESVATLDGLIVGIPATANPHLFFR